jgi:phosphatidylserine/phosphatidylglycerophosphate/cardiolipin synthase-like enzyme
MNTLFIALILSLITTHSDARTSFNSQIKKEAKILAKKASDKIEDANTPAPKDNEACFSPDQNCDEKLKKFILSAKESLDVAIFEVNDQKIIDAIIEQSFKVKTRLVINRKLRNNPEAMEQFKKNKLFVRVGKQKGIMHNKFVIVDGKRLETGSFNFTNGAANSNQENQLYLSIPSIVEQYKVRFQSMWEKGITR